MKGETCVRRTVAVRVGEGSVQRCPCCQRAEFVVGTSVFSLHDEDIEILSRSVDAMLQGEPDRESARVVRLPIESTGLYLEPLQLKDFGTLLRVSLARL